MADDKYQQESNRENIPLLSCGCNNKTDDDKSPLLFIQGMKEFIMPT